MSNHFEENLTPSSRRKPMLKTIKISASLAPPRLVLFPFYAGYHLSSFNLPKPFTVFLFPFSKKQKSVLKHAQPIRMISS